MLSESLLLRLLTVACALLEDVLPAGAWHANRKLREDADEWA